MATVGYWNTQWVIFRNFRRDFWNTLFQSAYARNTTGIITNDLTYTAFTSVMCQQESVIKMEDIMLKCTMY